MGTSASLIAAKPLISCFGQRRRNCVVPRKEARHQIGSFLLLYFPNIFFWLLSLCVSTSGVRVCVCVQVCVCVRLGRVCCQVVRDERTTRPGWLRPAGHDGLHRNTTTGRAFSVRAVRHLSTRHGVNGCWRYLHPGTAAFRVLSESLPESTTTMKQKMKWRKKEINK